MNKLFSLLGMYTALTGMPAPNITSNILKKQISEVNEVCKWLKCSKEELYERYKINNKLLSKSAGMYLESLINKNK